MDCLEGMASMEPRSVDLIITDPPFAIDFKAKRSNYNRTGGRVLDGYNEIKPCDYAAFSADWMRLAARCLKESGSMYVFSGWNNLKDILVALDETGLTLVNHIIWKYQFGVVTRRKFVTSHYHCLYTCIDDTKRKFFPYSRYSREQRDPDGGSAHYRDKEDVWYIKREYWTGKKKTPTKLPAELIRKILMYSSEPGDVILDPFLGSGQVAVVSKMENRRFIGFEIVPEYFRFARERLTSGKYRLDSDDTKSNTIDEEQGDLFGDGGRREEDVQEPALTPRRDR
jgi:site-specific DNA-methyltransferase (adenine-specific)